MFSNVGNFEALRPIANICKTGEKFQISLKCVYVPGSANYVLNEKKLYD